MATLEAKKTVFDQEEQLFTEALAELDAEETEVQTRLQDITQRRHTVKTQFDYMRRLKSKFSSDLTAVQKRESKSPLA